MAAAPLPSKLAKPGPAKAPRPPRERERERKEERARMCENGEDWMIFCHAIKIERVKAVTYQDHPVQLVQSVA